MAKKVLIILAEGAEEMEFVISADVLRRCGVEVTVAGLSEKNVKCSRDVTIIADTLLADVAEADFDAVVLPGGLGGAKAMADSDAVKSLLNNYVVKEKIIAAICAAPTVLLKHSIGLGKSITSYPSFKEQLSKDFKYVDDRTVVVDGNFITSRGPATAFDFALKLGEVLVGEEKVKQVAGGMLYQ